MVSVSLPRTSWNSSSKELGPSTDDGTAGPLTRPTWGNKFPIARGPALFLLLPPKPKGSALKTCRGVGTLNTLTMGSEKGGDLNSLTFYFKFCLFAKYGFFWFCFCLVREMKWDWKGTFH